jgi:uncharacterized protein (DUF433 family)
MDGTARVAPEAIDRIRIFEGCYEAHRAAELAGVPKSTVYDWARKGVVVPSVSASRVKLWSYADLMALRIIYWLRKPKDGEAYLIPAGEVKATPMTEVRSALDQLRQLDRLIWEPTSAQSPVVVDHRGVIHLRHEDGVLVNANGQIPLDEELLDPIRPFLVAGLKGPDLLRPRPHLRIVPGKVSGEPHLVGSRLTSPTLAALSRRGFPITRIVQMYPHESQAGIEEAIELEQEIAPAAA